MKKKMKRPLAVLLALIMMFSTVSGTGLNLSAEELQTSEVEILTTEDSTADTEEDKSGDTKDINQEEAPEVENESEGDELTESEESEDEVEPAGDIESEKDVQPASEEEDKSEPVTETEDDAESEKTETPAEITRYDYKSDEVNVLVTLTDPADLPDAAELVVESITLQREAQKNIEEAAAEEGIFVEEIKAFDIKFMLEGEEVQPGATVKVSVSVPEFKPSEEASAVYHVDENNEVENMESEVAADGEVVFDAPHFSTYVIVDGSIINDADQTIRMVVKHYEYGYEKYDSNLGKNITVEIADSTVEEHAEYQLYSDDVIDVPAGGKIYNYIKADGWKPAKVVITPGAELANEQIPSKMAGEDNVITDSTTLTEITVDGAMADEVTNGEETYKQVVVWVYYIPDRTTVYGGVGFYDYTVYTEVTVDGNPKVYSINDNIDQYMDDGNEEKILIVGDAKYDYSKTYTENKKFSSNDKTKGFWNRAGYKYGLSIFGNSDGKYLSEKGDVLFNYKNPGFFDTSDDVRTTDDGDVYLRKHYDDFQVGFTREGNTYTFDQVVYPNNTNHYEKGITNGWDRSGENFYPLDECTSQAEQSYYGTYLGHNEFWGMRYDISFTIGDYVGDMSFESKTRGDFLIVLDGDKPICQSLGTDSPLSSGEVDLWEYVFGANYNKYNLTEDVKNQEHTLTVLFMDRFASNQPANYGKSICNIEFTLPNAKIYENVATNKTNMTELKLQTVNQSGNSLAGASFQLKNNSTDITESLTTTTAGVTFDSLTVGEYSLMLATAPNNCVADENSWKVTVNKNNEGGLEILVVEENTAKTVSPTADGIYIIGVTEVYGTKLTLQAVSNDADAIPLGGAKFKLENKEGTFSETKTSDYVTGELDFSGLLTGTYTLTHVKAPNGCMLIGTVTEWKVTVKEKTEGGYLILISPDDETYTYEDDTYVFKYSGNYVKPEGAFDYDKTARLTNWENRTYEIDISAKSIESETIEYIDTTYGMLVFDISSTMGQPSTESSSTISASDNKTFSSLNKDYIYKESGSNNWILYLEDAWQRFDGRNWSVIVDTTMVAKDLERSNIKIEVLKEVAINYVKNLVNASDETKLGIAYFYEMGKSQTIWNLNDNIFNGTGEEKELNKDILKVILNLQTYSRTYLYEGLMRAYEQLVGSYTYDLKVEYQEHDNEFSYGKDNDNYITAIANDIPLYVILVSDGNADHPDPAKDWAKYLKSKGVTIYTVATNNSGDAEYKKFLKSIASFGCAYEVSEQDSLSEIFSQIQRTISAGTISDVTIKDYIDSRFVVLDDYGKQITKDYYCEDGCTAHPFEEEVKITTDDDQYAMVGYDSQGQYIRWDNQSISAEENHWTVLVQARDNYLGGNNVTTNIDGISVIDTPNHSYPLPNPTVNVKAELAVDNNAFTIYKGEVVPTADAITKVLFDVDSIINKYNASNLTGKFALNWYKDSACTEETTLEAIAGTPLNKQTKYYLQVIYNAGIPTEESKEKTTLNGTEYFVGEESTGAFVASNKNDSTLPYGVYTINVWELIKHEEGRTDSPLSDAEFQLTSKVDSPMNTYYGKSDNSGSVVWYTDRNYQIAVEEIKAGEYWLEESKAPDGYEKISDPANKWTVAKNAASGWTVLPIGTGISGETLDNDTDGNGIIEVYLANSRATHTITVTKKVTGNLGDKRNRSFTFFATLTDASGNPIDFPTVDGCTRVAEKTNEVTFPLKHGESMVIAGIQEGATLAIYEDSESLDETDEYDYTVESVKHGGVDKIDDYKEKGKVEITGIKEDSTLEFTNKKEATLGTGILSDTPKVQNTLLAVTFAASVIGILAYLDRKRSKYDYRR